MTHALPPNRGRIMTDDSRNEAELGLGEPGHGASGRADWRGRQESGAMA